MKKIYVTFQIKKVIGFNEYTPIFDTFKYAVECDNIKEATEIASDIYSIDGIRYLNINKSGRIKKDVKILNKNNYLKEV